MKISTIRYTLFAFVAIQLLFNTCLTAQQLQLNELNEWYYQEVVEETLTSPGTPLATAGFKLSTDKPTLAVAEGSFNVAQSTVAIGVYYELTVEVREGRYRLSISNFEIQNSMGSRNSLGDVKEKHQQRWVKLINEKLPAEVLKIKKALISKSNW